MRRLAKKQWLAPIVGAVLSFVPGAGPFLGALVAAGLQTAINGGSIGEILLAAGVAFATGAITQGVLDGLGTALTKVLPTPGPILGADGTSAISFSSASIEVAEKISVAEPAFQASAGAQAAAVGGAAFDPTTERNLKTLHPHTEAVARDHLELMRAEGINARVISGTRSYAEQDALYRQGRPQLPGGTKGPVITNARGGESPHNFGVAYDIAILDNSGAYIKSGADPAYVRAAEIGSRLGLEPGEKFKAFADPSHFQETRGLDLRVIRGRFDKGQDVFTGR